MRKRLAATLRRWAYRIDPPQSPCPNDMHLVGLSGRCPCGSAGGGSGQAVHAGGFPPERRESRGWN